MAWADQPAVFPPFVVPSNVSPRQPPAMGGSIMGDPRDDLRQRAREDGIEFFFAMFVDMHGKPCAKLIPASSFDLMMDGGAGFAGFAAGPMGQSPADPDMIAVPDP